MPYRIDCLSPLVNLKHSFLSGNLTPKQAHFFLSRNLIGQEEAVNFLTGWFSSFQQAQLRFPAFALFAGPTGTGKSYAVKLFSHLILRNEQPVTICIPLFHPFQTMESSLSSITEGFNVLLLDELDKPLNIRI